MERFDATDIMARLVAAYPWVEIGEHTVNVYVDFIAKLDDAPTALEAIETLIEHERYFPSIAQIRDVYATKRTWARDERALPEPAVTEAERAANIARVRDMSARLDGE